MEIYYDEWESPIGPLLVLACEEGIIRIDYGRMKDLKDEISAWLLKNGVKPIFIKDSNQTNQAKKELEQYFKGELRKFAMQLHLFGTPFQKKVWQALLDDIPHGQTKSYQDIAYTIGNPKAVRAVGGAVNRNPVAIVVPCHRVIGKNGKLIGYNGGLDKKEFLLKHEGFLN